MWKDKIIKNKIKLENASSTIKCWRTFKDSFKRLKQNENLSTQG